MLFTSGRQQERSPPTVPIAYFQVQQTQATQQQQKTKVQQQQRRVVVVVEWGEKQ